MGIYGIKYLTGKIRRGYNLFMEPFRVLGSLEEKLEKTQERFDFEMKNFVSETEKFKTLFSKRESELREIKQNLNNSTKKLKTVCADLEFKSGKYTKH